MMEMNQTEIRAALMADRQAQLDDLLSRWDDWLHPITVGRGVGSSAAGCSMYTASRQYDDENGALDRAIEHRVMQGVQGCVDKLEPQHRAAIYIDARNQRLGLAMWRSPRLPDNPEDARAILAAARIKLIDLLLSAGIVE